MIPILLSILIGIAIGIPLGILIPKYFYIQNRVRDKINKVLHKPSIFEAKLEEIDWEKVKSLDDIIK